jgi:hypothetical protein
MHRRPALRSLRELKPRATLAEFTLAGGSEELLLLLGGGRVQPVRPQIRCQGTKPPRRRGKGPQVQGLQRVIFRSLLIL